MGEPCLERGKVVLVDNPGAITVDVERPHSDLLVVPVPGLPGAPGESAEAPVDPVLLFENALV